MWGHCIGWVDPLIVYESNADVGLEKGDDLPWLAVGLVCRQSLCLLCSLLGQ